MPQIDLKPTKKAIKKSSLKKSAKSTDPFQSRNPWSSPWGDDFGDFLGDKEESNSPRMTPQERVTMIEKVYEEVLGRKPDTRDINYYKYSTLSEDEIRRQLLSGKEHKQLVEDGREFKKMRERATSAETKIKMLEAQNHDQLEEFKQLTRLLKEKNIYIQELRSKLNNPYNFVGKDNPPTTNPITPNTFNTAQSNVNEASGQIFIEGRQADDGSEKTSIIDRIKSIVTP